MYFTTCQEESLTKQWTYIWSDTIAMVWPFPHIPRLFLHSKREYAYLAKELKSCKTCEECVEMVKPWQLCRTIGLLSFPSQETILLKGKKWNFFLISHYIRGYNQLIGIDGIMFISLFEKVWPNTYQMRILSMKKRVVYFPCKSNTIM